jgi:hypothetical protein
MNGLTEARSRIADALDTIGVGVHWAAPSTLTPPCVVVLPRDPWIQPMGNVGLAVDCHTATAAGNAEALAALEQIVADVRAALYAAGLSPGVVAPPEVSSDSHTLHAAVPVTIRTDCY